MGLAFLVLDRVVGELAKRFVGALLTNDHRLHGQALGPHGEVP